MVRSDTQTDITFVEVDFDPFAGPELLRLAPITESQEEIWASCQLGGDDANRAYNESVSLKLQGSLDKSALERALLAVVQQHEALRSAFSADGRQICVFQVSPIKADYIDCSKQKEEEKKAIVASYLLQDALHVFDLLNGPLIKAGLIKLSDPEHQLVLTAHHLVCDGWSMGIILQDLSALYSAYAQNVSPKLPEPASYSRYAVEQEAFEKSSQYRQIETFWIDQYSQTVPVVDLPTDFPRPALRTYKSSRRDYPLDDGLVLAVKQMGIKAGSSFVTTLVAAFEALLHRLTGQQDITLGLPAAGQSATGNLRLVGHCVNLLPLRSTIQSGQRFDDFLRQRKEEVLNAYEHQQLTFGSLLKKLPISRDASRVPLVPVIFNVDIGLDSGVDFYGLEHQLISNAREFETVDLSVNVSGSSATSLTIECSYNTQLFQKSTIDWMMAEFVSLLKAVVANPSICIEQIPLTNQSDLLRKLANWNNTAAEYPRNTPLHELLAKTAAAFPQKTALIANGHSLDYQTLHQKADQAARAMQAGGLNVGDVVGVVLDRSPELVIALLAILKAGAAYVPIDPTYPQDRIAFMLSDSSAGLLITSKKYAGRLEHQAKEVLIESLLATYKESSHPEVYTTVSGSDLAYILYTSGSTGRPKGVLIEHENLVNLLYSMITLPGITSDDVLLGVTTVSFDIAGLELYLPLLVGATLVLADSETAKDGRALLDKLDEPVRTNAGRPDQPITIMQATPVTWKMMLAAGWEKKLPLKVLCCGEPLSKDLAQKLTARCDTLWNMYGPTETTIYSTGKQILATDEIITIGWPINNTQVYVLDKQLKPQPEGIVGEIYIAGDGVARGYLNRPELTEEKFVPNPFAGSMSAKMYRTGDLGKFMANGEIHCLGRSDQQIKIRGYRVEPGEVEQALQALDGVKEALVVAREDRPGDQRLAAYLVLKSPSTDEAFTNQVLLWRTKLQEVLPDYMVPSDFVYLTEFPVTPNGKIDRKALPKPNSALRSAGKGITEPVTDTEKLITAIWADTLGLEKVGIHDNFFELGGHSMIAVQVMTRLEKETGRRLPLSTLMTYPTIHKLAQLFQENKPATKWKSLVPIKPQGSKVPIYIIHGIGLNLLNFSSFLANMDPEQPIYGLQARGLDGIDEPLDTMESIAEFYNSEVLEQNPTGPYAIAGYSFGGYVALEMARQLKAMGKEVKLLAMLDTNAQEWEANYSLVNRWTRKIRRQFPKIVWFTKSLLVQPIPTIRYQQQYIERQINSLLKAVGLREEPEPEKGFDLLSLIVEKHEIAYQNYKMKPYDGVVDLFKAKTRLYFVDDNKFLGWKKYALKGVRVHEVPGDHQMMLLPPNDKVFAQVLQKALDND
ncbi:amino acid adenylation domain-containing protein [Spirosoma sp. RP8]|uniref:Amino acid adenylation domain-containing protein n=1 Tax=Spirosoma liriopis TaxID=2937440 RepID=A0ABT0HU33_9BACT|nr:non-ribosomal peptide synthetase [Spirosoma liriopis]MCK8495658.1 amino acid adenylation domain-containing protein [Spirosoma liriopis]